MSQKLTPEMQAYAERIAKEAQERNEKEIAEMTPEIAEARIRTAAQILGDNDYLSAEYQLLLIADWLKTQQSKEVAQ